ncbi:hypothetical protein GCM10009827_062100 [Dactylosporangium maewongense]|uniref:Uncharacterized protein n=1 Tax=Dactylosporangium maewongense TaxID=634393 RepID=A0ABN2B8V5_9ACTN
MSGNGNQEARNAGFTHGSHRMVPAGVSISMPAWPVPVTRMGRTFLSAAADVAARCRACRLPAGPGRAEGPDRHHAESPGPGRHEDRWHRDFRRRAPAPRRARLEVPGNSGTAPSRSLRGTVHRGQV